MTTMKHRKSDTPDDIRSYVMDFEQIGSHDLARVGGKNASLGELFRALKPKGVGVPDGFATTAHAYRRLLREPGLEERSGLNRLLIGSTAERVVASASCPVLTVRRRESA